MFLTVVAEEGSAPMDFLIRKLLSLPSFLILVYIQKKFNIIILNTIMLKYLFSIILNIKVILVFYY